LAEGKVFKKVTFSTGSLGLGIIMKKKIFLSVFFLALVFCVSASAHQDRIITMENGKLIGLPERYQPAHLDLQKKSLRIGANQFNFPACVLKYFPNDDQYDIKITSSWYHDLSILPPYLSISIQPRGKDYSFDLLFDMDTLKPIKFEIQIRQPNMTSFHELVISDSCRKSIEESYTKIKQ
jgi:hypothetical protein